MKKLLTALFCIGLVSCGGSTPAPTLSSVAVTAASNALKLGATSPLTATAVFSDGTTSTAKTFTWNSSDQNIATVDTNGVVTAKRLGTVKILAGFEGTTGESEFKSYGLEISGGTRVGGVTGTALIARVRGKDLQSIASLPVQITEPAGWNADKPFDLPTRPCNATSSINFELVALGLVPPVAGTYQGSVTVAGETLTASFTLDTTQTLPALTVNTATATGTSTFNLAASWAAVTGALSYQIIFRDASSAIAQQFSGSTSTTVTGASKKATSVQVFGLSTDVIKICNENFIMPNQMNSTTGSKTIL